MKFFCLAAGLIAAVPVTGTALHGQIPATTATNSEADLRSRLYFIVAAELVHGVAIRVANLGSSRLRG